LELEAIVSKIKTTAGEWRAFCDTDWGHPDAWCEEEMISIVGTDRQFDEGLPDDVPAATALVVEDGVIRFPVDAEKEDKSLILAFRNWRHGRSTASILIECPHDAVGQITTAVKAMGGKIV
jgi:hypothetical protein